jgi:hypothetical protein
MIIPGNLVKYLWNDAIGLVKKVNNDRPCQSALVVWPPTFARECGVKHNQWWTPCDRYLLKVNR